MSISFLHYFLSRFTLAFINRAMILKTLTSLGEIGRLGDYWVTKGKFNLIVFWAVKEEFPVEVGKYKFCNAFLLLNSL